MITINLCGELADYFTPQVTVAINSVAEALASLKANFRNFANYLFEAANRGVNYRIQVGYEEIGEEQLKCPISKKVQSIRIMPVIAGSGGVGRIIAGVALLGLGLFGVGILGLTATSTALIGGALLFQGISALFSRQDTPNEEKRSSIFGGPSTTVKEGSRVPIIYGVVLTGIYVLSAKITTSFVAGSGGGGGGGGGK